MDTGKTSSNLLNINPEKNALEAYQKLQHLVSNATNISIIPSESYEAISASLALFYILKEQKKNANIIRDHIPENLTFLSPSLDFISYPKNFVLSIPETSGDISKVYFEKSNQSLKIHLQLEKGTIKKEDITCYVQEPKPDLVITLGVKDYSAELKEQLNAFGYLLGATIVNIDSHEENKQFGTINLVEKKSLAEIISPIFSKEAVTKKAAECLLTALLISTNNFKAGITAEVFELAGLCMKKGADFQTIRDNLQVHYFVN